MPIPVYCTNCNRQFQVADSLEGKQGNCPGCHVLLQFPLRPASEPEPKPESASEPQLALPPNLRKPASKSQSAPPQKSQSGEGAAAPSGSRQKDRALPQAKAIPQSTKPASIAPEQQPQAPTAQPVPTPTPTTNQTAGQPDGAVPIARTIAVGRKVKRKGHPKHPAIGVGLLHAQLHGLRPDHLVLSSQRIRQRLHRLQACWTSLFNRKDGSRHARNCRRKSSTVWMVRSTMSS